MFTLEGRVWKDGRSWLIEVPALDIMTQGKSKADAFEMIRDAIETHVHVDSFSVSITPQGTDGFIVSAETQRDVALLIGLMLKRQRAKNHLSLEDMRKRLNVRSRSNYAQYEKGASVPGIVLLSKFVEAMGVQAMLCFNVAQAKRATRHPLRARRS